MDDVRVPRWYTTTLGGALVASGAVSAIGVLSSIVGDVLHTGPDVRLTLANRVPLDTVLSLQALVYLAVGVGVLTRRSGLGPWLACLAVPTAIPQLHAAVTGHWRALVPTLAWLGQPWGSSLPLLLRFKLLVQALANLVWPMMALAGAGPYSGWASLRRPRAWATAMLVIVAVRGSLELEHRYNERLQRAAAKAQGAPFDPAPGLGRILLVARTQDPDVAVPDAAARVKLWPRGPGGPRTFDTRVANGMIELDRVPTGIYRVEVGIDGNPANGWLQGGDYFAGGMGDDIRLTIEEDGATARYETATQAVLTLREPHAMHQVGEQDRTRATLGSPVTFAWDPAPGAQTYRYSITKIGPRTVAVVARGEACSPQLTVDLPPTEPDERYQLSVTPYGEGTKVVGMLERVRAFEVVPEAK